MKQPQTPTLSDDARLQAIASLRQYAADNLDEEFGDLKARLLLDFILEDIGPAIYNQAILDARAFVEARAADLDAVLHYPEFPLSTKPRR